MRTRPVEERGHEHAVLDGLLRDERGRILSVLIRSLGDFDLAEDALQDAIAIALERWPTDGVPRNPAGWLVTAARRRAIDRLRKAVTAERNQDALQPVHEHSAEEEECYVESSIGF